MYSIKKIEIELMNIISITQTNNEQTNKQMSMTLESVAQRIALLEEQMTLVMEKVGIEAPTQSTKKGKKAAKAVKAVKADGEPKKKRSPTGYLMFASAMRPEAKASLIEDGNESPKPTEVITEVAKRWKALDDEEREKWNAKARETAEESDAE